LKSDLFETFKINAFNISFNTFVLDRFIGPFETCNGSFLVFVDNRLRCPLISVFLSFSFLCKICVRVFFIRFSIVVFCDKILFLNQFFFSFLIFHGLPFITLTSRKGWDLILKAPRIRG
jgi:hypothetical protein